MRSTTNTLPLFTALVLAVSSLSGQVVITSNNSDHEVKSMTVAKTLLGADVSSSTGLGYGSGTFTGGQVGDSFGVSTVLSSNFDIAAANAAITGGTFEAYVAGLTAGSGSGNIIDAAVNTYGANTSAQNDPVVLGYTDGDTTRLSNIGEALIWTFDTSGLNPGTQLSLTQLKTSNFNVGSGDDAYDMIVWNSASNLVTFSRSAATADFNFSASPIFLEDGDIMVIASNVEGTTFRVGPGNYNLTTIPEPSATIVFAFGTLLVAALRRRR